MTGSNLKCDCANFSVAISRYINQIFLGKAKIDLNFFGSPFMIKLNFLNIYLRQLVFIYICFSCHADVASKFMQKQINKCWECFYDIRCHINHFSNQDFHICHLHNPRRKLCHFMAGLKCEFLISLMLPKTVVSIK